MRVKNMILFAIIIFLVIAGVYTAFYGFSLGSLQVLPLKDSIKQGLDLKGGVFVVYEAQTDAEGDELDRIITQTIEVFRLRVDGFGLTEPIIVREGDKRIRVELPGVENAQDAIDMIGQTAQLTFVAADNEEVVLTGSNVKNAEAAYGEGGQVVVSLEFDSEGADKFAEATARVSQTDSPFIAIILDDEILSFPSVEGRITGGRAQISGSFTAESAARLAALIRAGGLPVNLKEVQSSTITATLGVNALNRSLLAAQIGIVLVYLFILFFYRLPGLMANLALTIYILLVLFIYALFGATLTLPGIAALILSVGMAVDANVIIFERIKEELRVGKSIRAAVEAGFKRAFTSILDSNVTTFIAGIVLYQFGTGPIRGFALTLMIGIGVSMFTAVFVTRLLMNLLVGMNLTKNTKLYGA